MYEKKKKEFPGMVHRGKPLSAPTGVVACGDQRRLRPAAVGAINSQKAFRRAMRRERCENNKQPTETKVMNNQFDVHTKGLAQSVTCRAALMKFGTSLAGF